MSGAEIMAVAGFICLLFGYAFGVWKYVDGKITAVRNEASTRIDAASALVALARVEISEHKIHSAETFATKDGMQRQTDQLLKAIESVAVRINGLNERLDRVFESPRRRAT